MSTTRRQFLGTGAVLGSAVLSGAKLPLAKRFEILSPAEGKKILILGGTGFLGPKTIAAALARGHKVTVFNRGKREKFIPVDLKDVEHLYGNRDPELPADDERGEDKKLLHPDAKPKGLEQLEGRAFDAVIDNSGYFPRMVRASAELTHKAGAKQYVFISTISVYAGMSKANGDEDSELAKLSDPKTEDFGKNFENYGGGKVLCEQAVSEIFPGHATIVRPGYIVGPGDPTDRFTYWPVRIGRGGEALIPGSPSDPIEMIDVRDLAEWLVKLVEDGTAGTFNAVNQYKWGDVIQACAAAAKAPPKLTWVPSEWLEKNGMGGEDSFPIWAPPTGETAGAHTWKFDRAVKAGLKFRPVSDTVKATNEWYPGDLERRIKLRKDFQAQGKKVSTREPSELPGPPAEREAELLVKFKETAAKEGKG